VTLETKGFIVVVCAIAVVVLFNAARNPRRAWRDYIGRRYKYPQYHEASSRALERDRFWYIFSMVTFVGIAGLVIASPSDQELRRRREDIQEEMRRMRDATPTPADLIQEQVRRAVPKLNPSLGTPPKPTPQIRPRATP
jgi:hypothetical protein